MRRLSVKFRPPKPAADAPCSTANAASVVGTGPRRGWVAVIPAKRLTRGYGLQNAALTAHCVWIPPSPKAALARARQKANRRR
jgi:hypothetical protein